jgi:hypothetical protein
MLHATLEKQPSLQVSVVANDEGVAARSVQEKLDGSEGADSFDILGAVENAKFGAEKGVYGFELLASTQKMMRS